MDKGLRYYSREDIQTPKKHEKKKKRCSASLIIGKCKSKPQNITSHPSGQLLLKQTNTRSKKQEITSVGKDEGNWNL